MQQRHQNSAVPFIYWRTFKTEKQYQKGEFRKGTKYSQESLHPPLFQIVFGLHRVVSRRTKSGYKGRRSTPTYKSTLCSAEVELGRSFIAEIPCTSSHLSWLMRDTSGYWKTISVVCKFSINHEQDGVFWWRWDCNVLHRKKLSAPESGSQKEGSSFCILFSATNTVTARKGPQSKEVGKQFLLKGPTDWLSTQEAWVARIEKNRLSQAAFLAPLCTPGTVLAYLCPATWLQRTRLLLLQTARSYHAVGAPGRKPGGAGWTGTSTGANPGEARFHAKWGSKTYPSADNFEIFNKSTKFNSDEWNVVMGARPKKCSWQSFLKVLEEHFKGAKPVRKSPAFTSQVIRAVIFRSHPWVFSTGHTHEECLTQFSS